MFDSGILEALVKRTFGFLGVVLGGVSDLHWHGLFLVFDGPADMAGNWFWTLQILTQNFKRKLKVSNHFSDLSKQLKKNQDALGEKNSSNV